MKYPVGALLMALRTRMARPVAEPAPVAAFDMGPVIAEIRALGETVRDSAPPRAVPG